MSYNGSVETSALAGVACNAILYGAQLVVFPICMTLLIQRQRQHKRQGDSVSWILISAVIAQFILSTMYISIQLYMTFQSFVRLQPTGSTLTTSSPPAPTSMQSIVPEPSPTWWTGAPPIPTPTTAILSTINTSEPIFSVSGWASKNQQQWSAIALYWIDTTSKVQILSSTVCFVNTIIGDSILIWRLYHVWGEKWIFCIPPITSLMASVICATLVISIQSASIYNVVDKLAMAGWGLSISTQVIATLIVAFRIWYIQRTADKSQVVDSPYKKIMLIIVESGAIYSAMALALLILYSMRQLGAAVVLMGCTGQTAAIIPATIVILVHLRLRGPKDSVQSKLVFTPKSDDEEHLDSDLR